MATKLGRVATYLEGLCILSLGPLRPMDTKLGKVLTYCEKLTPLKPHDTLIILKNLYLYFYKTYDH